MKRPKYHFIALFPNGGGTSLMALPGQTFGNTPVPTDILIRDRKGSGPLVRMKKSASSDAVYFTTTLRPGGHCLLADDILPVHGHGNVLYPDAENEYESYLQKQ